MRNPVPELVFLAAYLVWMLPEVIGTARDLRDRPVRPPERRDDGASGFVILLGIGALPVTGVAVSLTIRSAAILRLEVVLFVVGIAAMLLGVALRWYSVHTLGRFFSRSIAIQDHHEIVTAGPYRILRHPSYAGTVLTLLGIGLVTGNWLSLLTMVAGGFAAYAYRVVREEQVLIRELGQPYLDYMKRTKRFIPGLF